MTPLAPQPTTVGVVPGDRDFGAEINKHTSELITKFGVRANPIKIRGTLHDVTDGWQDQRVSRRDPTRSAAQRSGVERRGVEWSEARRGRTTSSTSFVPGLDGTMRIGRGTAGFVVGVVVGCGLKSNLDKADCSRMARCRVSSSFTKSSEAGTVNQSVISQHGVWGGGSGETVAVQCSVTYRS
jgi:hypothetical protein